MGDLNSEKNEKNLFDDGANQSDAGEEKQKGGWFDWIQCIVAALICTILVFMFLGRIIGVDGRSMYPTLHNGDKVIMSNLFYTPKAGDIVILTKFSFENSPIVKRVIATENQTVDIRDGIVYVDEEALDESYLQDGVVTRELDIDFPQTVPEGHILVMGDNRGESTDGRSSRIGMVDTRCVLGKVYAVIWPFSAIGTVK